MTNFPLQMEDEIITKRHYFKGDANIYKYRCRQNRHDLYKFVNQMKERFRRAIYRQLGMHPAGIRWSITATVRFKKTLTVGEETIIAHFRSFTFTSFRIDDIRRKLDTAF